MAQMAPQLTGDIAFVNKPQFKLLANKPPLCPLWALKSQRHLIPELKLAISLLVLWIVERLRMLKVRFRVLYWHQCKGGSICMPYPCTPILWHRNGDRLVVIFLLNMIQNMVHVCFGKTKHFPIRRRLVFEAHWYRLLGSDEMDVHNNQPMLD